MANVKISDLTEALVFGDNDLLEIELSTGFSRKLKKSNLGFDGLYVELTGAQSVDGIKTWNDKQVFVDGFQLKGEANTDWIIQESSGNVVDFVYNTLSRMIIRAGDMQQGYIATGSFFISFAAATATLPIFGFKGDTTTGMGRAADHQLSLIADGIEGARIDAATTPGFAQLVLNPDGALGVNTGLAFGDGDTRIYEITDDQLSFSPGANNTMLLTTSQMKGSGGNNFLINCKGVDSSTIPHYTFRADQDTGIGTPAADQLSIITGGLECARFDELTVPGKTRLWINPDGNIADGSGLWFGANGTTGMQLNTEGAWWFEVSGAQVFLLAASYVYVGSATGAPYMRVSTGTVTTPSYSFRSDGDTGIYWVSADQMALVAGGIEGARIDGITAPGFARLWLNSDAAIGVNTGLWFGDGDTGIYEGLNNQIYISIAGNIDAYRINASSIRTDNSLRWGLLNETPSATNPVFVPSVGDIDTGMGWAGADQLSLIAGGVEGVRIDELTVPGFARAWLNPDGAVGINTGLWFGDGDTGIYELSDDQLAFETAGSIMIFKFGRLIGSISNTPAIRFTTGGGATTPNIHPRNGDLDTGVGSAGDDQLSLIAGGVEGLRIDELTAPGFARVWINPDGAVGVNTGIRFGDGDTGFSELTDDNLHVYVGGTTPRFIFKTSSFQSYVSGGFYCLKNAASNIIPSYAFSDDTNTGIGHAGADLLSLIAGGVEGAQISTTQVSLQAPAAASTPHKNGAISFDLDESGNNLIIRVLYSGGTAKTATIALV